MPQNGLVAVQNCRDRTTHFPETHHQGLTGSLVDRYLIVLTHQLSPASTLVRLSDISAAKSCSSNSESMAPKYSLLCRSQLSDLKALLARSASCWRNNGSL